MSGIERAEQLMHECKRHLAMAERANTRAEAEHHEKKARMLRCEALKICTEVENQLASENRQEVGDE